MSSGDEALRNTLDMVGFPSNLWDGHPGGEAQGAPLWTGNFAPSILVLWGLDSGATRPW